VIKKAYLKMKKLFLRSQWELHIVLNNAEDWVIFLFFSAENAIVMGLAISFLFRQFTCRDVAWLELYIHIYQDYPWTNFFLLDE
jgi:hypothetical protein